MKHRLFTLVTVMAVFYAMSLQAGIKWKAKMTTQDKKTNAMIVQMYAQGGNVRQEFIEVKGGDNDMQEKGMYWLFLGDREVMIVVNPKEKTYMEVPIGSAMQMAGAVAQVVKTTITDPKATMDKVGSGQVLGYDCDQIKATTSYDLETKVAFMKTKNHIETETEYWATKALPASDLASAFSAKTLKTGMEDLDRLIEQQMKAYGDMGFVLKSVGTTNTTDKKGKTQTTTNTMEVLELSQESLSADLFKVPEGYEATGFAGME